MNLALPRRLTQMLVLAVLAALTVLLPACVATVRARPARAVYVAPAPAPRSVVVVRRGPPHHPHHHGHHRDHRVRVRVVP